MKFKCDLCEEKFSSMYGLRDHVIKKHNKKISAEKYYYKYIANKVTGCNSCGHSMKLIWLKKQGV